MQDELFWAARFEEHRPRLRAVAYRMLGSFAEADDAVQETWLRVSRASGDDVANVGGWLTTIVSRQCLTMLRSRASRREDPLDVRVPDPVVESGDATDPAEQGVLADSVGLALLVVLEALDPAERLAFVLHDMFAVPFDDIAPMVGRSPAAARQLASRARRRIQGSETDAPDSARLGRQRQVVEAFLAATRGGDLAGLIAILDPDVVLTSDGTAVPAGVARTVRGAQAVARGARAAAMRSRYGRLALVNGAPGLVMAPGGRLVVALAFTFAEDRIIGIDVIADPERLAGLDLAVLG